MKNAYKFTLTLLLIGLLITQTSSNFIPAKSLARLKSGSISEPQKTNSVNDLVTFKMLGEPETILTGPYATYFLRFYTPLSWKIKAGVQIQLHIDASYTVNNQTAPVGVYGTGATMSVTYNGNTFKTIVIDWTGDKTVIIPIPAEALQSTRADGGFTLTLFLDASVDCNLLHKTTIVLKDDSGFILPYDTVIPEPDLTQLPRPIYDISPLQTTTAALVVPNNPSAEELRAALIVEAGFSRMTNGKLALPLYTLSELSETIRTTNHLIFVGNAINFPILRGLNFPAVLNETQVNWPDSQPDDGFIQMILSPWKIGNTVLFVGGNSAGATIKAAQALSTGKLQIGPKPNLMVISNVFNDVIQPAVAVDRTLKDLGYAVQTAGTLGANFIDYQFYVTPGMVPGINPSVSVVYTHSALLDFARSGLFVRLNNQTIGSAVFSADSAKQTNTLTISLPASLIRSGYNRLTVEADLLPNDNCSIFQTDNLWATISDDTKIHLPLINAQTEIISSTLDLKNYPYPLNVDPTLSNLAFILSPKDTLSWKIAAQIAANLGGISLGNLFNPNLAFADNISDQIRMNHDLIIVGQANQIPFINELGNAMPAPFEPNSNYASEKGMQVTYRLPKDANLGYLELFSPSWNPQRTILTVLGSTPVGLQWAGNALIFPTLTIQLSGNYDVISGNQVLVTDTRLKSGTGNLSATALPGSVPIAITTPTTSTSTYDRNWIIPVLGVLTLIILIIIIVVLVSRLINRKRY